MTPLVSVLMPCYNSHSTLGWALASLIAQTYADWECVLVDDGSTDNPKEVVDEIDDTRIRYIRFERNLGRGAARQISLDNAKGGFVCMLDADDWYYPSKLARQLEVLTSEPRVALVSTGMAIVDARNEIAGVRTSDSCTGTVDIRGPVRGLKVAVAHAPSMIRADLARRVSYDPSLPMSEDFDYLIRLLQGRAYGVIPDVTYVYSELASVTEAKILDYFTYVPRILRKYRSTFPIASLQSLVEFRIRESAYRLAFGLGCGDAIIRRRSRLPTAHEVAEFQAAVQQVTAVAGRLGRSDHLHVSTVLRSRP